MADTGTGFTKWTSLAVCSCLYQATVSRHHYYGIRTDVVWYTDVQTGLAFPLPVDNGQQTALGKK
jgi:hypothetical protein